MTRDAPPAGRLLIGEDCNLMVGRAFVGEHTDEFALAASVVPQEGSVLVLGGGFGGPARSILACSPHLKVVAVEAELGRIQHGRRLFAEYFPQQRLEFVHDRAETFLTNGATWHAIWIDLYVGRDYSPLMFSPAFFTMALRALRPGGALLVNAFGLPWHLDPLRVNGAQARTACALADAASHPVGMIPYRRNLTMVVPKQRHSARDARMEASEPPGDSGDLLATVFVRLNRLRTRFPQALWRPLGPRLSTARGLFSEESALQDSRWQHFMSDLKATMLHVPRDLAVAADTERFLRTALDHGHRAAAFLPAYTGSYLGAVGGDPDWLTQWLADRCTASDLERHGDWVIHHALPQALSCAVSHHRTAVSMEAVAKLERVITRMEDELLHPFTASRSC